MPKTLVTLDFDGVVSPIDHDRDFTLERDWKQFKLGLYVDIHKNVLCFLRELRLLDLNGEITLAWASTWLASTEDFAEKTEAEIPSIPWIPLNEGKAEAIIAKVESGGFERVVVMEDSSKVVAKLRAWGKLNPQIELLLIQPKLKVGLTNSQMLKVQEFLKI